MIEARAEENLLQKRLREIVREVEQTGASIGVLVQPMNLASDQQPWFSHDADKLFTPASNTKIVTVATALVRLGGDYRFKTEVAYTGELRDGILRGDLYVKGYGDPSLYTDELFQAVAGVSLRNLVDAIREKNIRQIDGNLYVDASFFDEQRLGNGWAWDYESEYYSAQTSALSINRGTVQLVYKPGVRSGEPVQLSLLPNTRYVHVLSEAKTVAAGEENTLEIIRLRGSNVIRVTGNLPVGEEGEKLVTVDEPALYLGTLLRESLEGAGVVLSPQSKVQNGAVPVNRTLIAELYSAPLREIAKHLNKTSDNHYAEMLLKTLGAVCKGEGSAEAGVEVVREVLQELGIAGMYQWRDGSGLSPYNLVSPRQLFTLLQAIASRPEYEDLVHSFPCAGVDGTLENRLKDSPLYRRVFAKTGTLTSVSSLSGYADLPDGERIIFSIMANRYPGETDYLKAQEDRILQALAAL